MASYACLRVELPQAWADRLEPLHGKLAKVVETFLETRWLWPRRFDQLTALSFLLVDARASAPPADELGQLADQLQHHLFGGADEGEVALLLFEGPPEAVMDFARLSHDEVLAAMADPQQLPPRGRLTRLRPGAAPVLAAASVPAAEAPVPPPAPPPPDYRIGVLGTYLLSRQAFVADTLAAAPQGASHHFSVIEDRARLPRDEALFDEACFRGAAGVLARMTGGRSLGTPVAYSHFVRPGQLHWLQRALKLLPRQGQERLTAQVYGAPRHLSHGVEPYLPLLQAHFAAVSLVTSDPEFEIEPIAPKSLASVVCCLHDQAQPDREAAIRAFGARAEAYRQRGVEQVLANVRTLAEIELALRQGLQLVSGPAIGRFREAPIGGCAMPLDQLPAQPA